MAETSSGSERERMTGPLKSKTGDKATTRKTSNHTEMLKNVVKDIGMRY